MTFMRNLSVFLDRKNYETTTELKHASGLFFPISHDVNELTFYRGCGLPVIQRLDGIYYPSKHGAGYRNHNDAIEKIYSNYSSHVVFQSEYSKEQCFDQMGIKAEGEYSLILNGADKSVWKPIKNKSQNKKMKFVTTGNFRNEDMIEPVVKALDKLILDYDFELHTIGPVTKVELSPFFERDYVVNHGSLPKADIVTELQWSDIFIYSHLNPPCPNSVIEAISCGLPIVGFDSGSMSELCYFNKDLLAYVSDDIFQTYAQFDACKLAEKIKLCMDNYDYYRACAMDNAHLYDFEECGAQYVEVFERELAKVPHISKLKREYEYKKLQMRLAVERGRRFGKRVKEGVGRRL